MGNDVEFFSPTQMAEAFTLERVNPNPARFDLKKCKAINGDWIRFISPTLLAELIVPFLVRAGLISEVPTEQEFEVLSQAVPLIQERLDTLSSAPELLAFLFTDSISPDRSLWTDESKSVLERSIEILTPLQDWSTDAIHTALRVALVEELQLKPKLAFGSVRAAITGQKISPPLFESMEILGQDSCLERLRRSVESLQGS